MHATSMQEKITDVPRKPSGNVERRTQIARCAEEMSHIRPASQPHTPQTGDTKRWPQFLRPCPQPARIIRGGTDQAAAFGRYRRLVKIGKMIAIDPARSEE